MSSSSEAHPHVTPIKVYLGVYGALLVATVLTVIVSYMNLGSASIYVAMAIAIAKAVLVAAIFMHLWHDEKFNTLVFAASVLFLFLFFGFTMMDVTTRGALLPEKDNFARFPEYATEDAEARRAAETHSVHVEGDHHGGGHGDGSGQAAGGDGH